MHKSYVNVDKNVNLFYSNIQGVNSNKINQIEIEFYNVNLDFIILIEVWATHL